MCSISYFLCRHRSRVQKRRCFFKNPELPESFNQMDDCRNRADDCITAHGVHGSDVRNRKNSQLLNTTGGLYDVDFLLLHKIYPSLPSLHSIISFLSKTPPQVHINILSTKALFLTFNLPILMHKSVIHNP